MKPLMLYAGTTFTTAGIAFGTFFLLTHHLTAADYGIIHTYNACCLLLSSVTGLGVQVLQGVDYFHAGPDQFRLRFRSAMMLPAAATLLATAVLFPFSGALAAWLQIDRVFTLTLPLVCLFLIVNDVFLIQLRNRGFAASFAALSVGKSVLEAGLTLLLVIGAAMAWRGRLIGTVGGLLLGLLAALWLVRRWRLWDGGLEQGAWKAQLREGLPFVPERLSVVVLAFSDRLFIAHFAGLDEVGYYSAGMQVAMVLRLGLLALVAVSEPAILQALAPAANNRVALWRINYRFLLVAALAAALLIIVAPFLFRQLLGAAFAGGQTYVLLLTLGMLAAGVHMLLTAYLLALKKGKPLMAISLCGMVLSLLLNYLLVRRWGSFGVACANLVVHSAMMLISLYFVHRYVGLRRLFLPGSRPLPAGTENRQDPAPTDGRSG